MNILLYGAQSDLGRQIEQILALAGHNIIHVLQNTSEKNDKAACQQKETDILLWGQRLNSIDCVINVQGDRQKKDEADGALIDTQTSIALCHACYKQGIKNVLEISALTSDSWQTMCALTIFEPEKITTLISTKLMPSVVLIAKKDAELTRLRAQSVWRYWLAVYIVSAIWLLTAIICLFFYPINDSLALLSQLAIPAWAQLPIFYFSCGLNVILGIGSLLWPSRGLWWLQIVIIVIYSILIAIGLGEYYLHPFAPIIKNLAVLALLFMLLAAETKS